MFEQTRYPQVSLSELVPPSRPITYGIVQPGPDISPDGVPLIRGKDYSSGKVNSSALYHVKPEIDKPYRRSKVLAGDILFSIVGYVGQSAVVPNELAGANITQTTARISVDATKADSLYVYHYLTSPHFRPQISRFEKGSAQPGLNLSDVERLQIGLPSHEAQRRIAEILSTMDEAIEQTEALIVKMRQIKAGLMHDLFTRGVTSNGQLRPPREEAPHLYKESPLGWIPKDWEVRRLGTILKQYGGYLQTGPFGSQLHSHEYQYEGVPVVMPQNINDGGIWTDQIARIKEAKAKELSRHRLRVGDIVIARRGELSRAAGINDFQEGWLCGTGCFLLRLGQSALHFNFAACVYTHDLIQRQIAGMAVGTTMPSLNNTVMERLFFPFCAPEEQSRITKKIESLDKFACVTQKQVTKLRQQKNGLMHDLLTGRVPVPQRSGSSTDEAKKRNAS